MKARKPRGWPLAPGPTAPRTGWLMETAAHSLEARGDDTRSAEFRAEALDLLLPLMDERPDDPIAAGELGITLVRLGEAEEALAFARLAGRWTPIEGLSFGPWILEDPDLAPLRGYPGYRAWIAPD